MRTGERTERERQTLSPLLRFSRSGTAGKDLLCCVSGPKSFYGKSLGTHASLPACLRSGVLGAHTSLRARLPQAGLYRRLSTLEACVPRPILGAHASLPACLSSFRRAPPKLLQKYYNLASQLLVSLTQTSCLKGRTKLRAQLTGVIYELTGAVHELLLATNEAVSSPDFTIGA